MLVDTIHGPMDETLLERRDIVIDNDNEHTKVTEYWFEGELVHRSAHVALKRSLTTSLLQGAFA